uniref:Uncharacterized protein n=1 Tax=Arion vulgaris TaxID=1028688 RepID=A0A0B7B3R3_9EUPU
MVKRAAGKHQEERKDSTKQGIGQLGLQEQPTYYKYTYKGLYMGLYITFLVASLNELKKS